MNTEPAREIIKKAHEIEIRTSWLLNDSLANQITSRCAIMFLVSEFELPNQDQALADVRRAVRLSSCRRDVMALHMHGQHESELPDAGQLAIKDAETGELVELNTRESDEPALRTFFKNRERRMR